jgi:serine/threonine protein kinase
MEMKKPKHSDLRLCPRCKKIHSTLTTCPQCASPLSLVDHTFFLRKTFGKYFIREMLGAGGMGIVFLAVHKTLDKKVALKVFIPGTEDSTFEKRFLREARILAGLKHPNIIEIHDFDVSPWGTPYYVMEYLHGNTLREETGNYPNGLPFQLFSDYLKQVVSPLNYAHKKGIIHRDLKPDNIFIETVHEERVVKLLDFGIAKSLFAEGEVTKLTAAGSILGTPYYLAPEQLVNRNIGSHTDQYALALIVVEMLTGKIARAKKTIGEIIDNELRRPLRADMLTAHKRIPQHVIQALITATEPNPKARFPDIDSFAAALLNGSKHKEKHKEKHKDGDKDKKVTVKIKPGDKEGKGTAVLTTGGRLPPEKFVSIEDEVILEARKKKRRVLMLIAFVVLIIALTVVYFVLGPF